MPSLHNALRLWHTDRALFRKRLVAIFIRLVDRALALVLHKPPLYHDVLAKNYVSDSDGRERFLTVFSCNPFLPSGVGTSILAQCCLIKRQGYALDAIFYVQDEVTYSTRDALLAYFDRASIIFPRTARQHRLADGVTAACLDTWCGQEALDICSAMLRDGGYAGVIVHQPWLSRLLEIVPEGTRKYLFMHDNFANRAALFASQGLEFHHAWLSVNDEEQARCLKRADIIFAVQEEEEELFARQAGEGKQVMTIKISLPDKTNLPLPPQEGKLTVGIVASANENNRIAVSDFIQLWEKKVELDALAELRIVGDIGQFVHSRAPSVRILGRVSDLDTFYTDISVVVNPDCGGTGLKVKSLEALSYGRPLLCSREGSLGFQSPAPYHALPDRTQMLIEVLRLAKQRTFLNSMRDMSIYLFRHYNRMEEYIESLKGTYHEL